MDAVILAGGENKRMPFIKSFIKINNKRIIESNIELLGKIFNRIIISTNSPEIYFYLGLPMIGDVINTRGPMTGIYSVLINPDINDIFVIGCDMPFIKKKLIKFILSKWNNEWDSIVPLFNSKPQPLLGIYSKRVLTKMEIAINNNQRSLMDFLCKINVLLIKEGEVKEIDPDGRSFVNINTLKDFKKEMGGRKCLV
ncbi:MAG: molybdenum cofactor guanylyltransferase [Nitrospirae bacterium]|nr:molybdenum cofactor guanylyltransferase [Nitrospirota bacterium]